MIAATVDRQTPSTCQTAKPGPGGMIFPVLLHGGAGKAESHDEEKESGNLEPQLVQNLAERSNRRACRLADRAQGPAAPGLLPCHVRPDPEHHTQLARCRHLIHFSILAVYGDTMTQQLPLVIRIEEQLGETAVYAGRSVSRAVPDVGYES